ncbi:MAG: hypothetical protein DRO15_07090 [Thermoprotei archaeon]|nr:MAG: hypothetical protein DRO15_07090 [Thermoprotei archaeon]
MERLSAMLNKNMTVKFIPTTMYFVVAFTGTLAFRLSIPVIAFYTRDILGATSFIITLIFISFMASRALTASITGYVVDKLPRAIFIAPIAMFINAPITYLYSLSSSWLDIVVLRIIQGICSGASWPLVQLSLAQVTPRNIRGRILSIYFIMGSIAAIIANAIYILIIDYPLTIKLTISSILFTLTSILILLGLIPSYRLVHRDVETRYRGVRTRSPLSSSDLSVIIGGFICSFLTSITMGDIAYIYISETLGVNKALAAQVVMYSGIVGFICSYFISWYADRVSTINALNLAITLAITSIPLISIKSFSAIILGFSLAGIGIKSFTPISRRYFTTYSKTPATGIGLINASSNIGTSGGQLVFGYIYDLTKGLALSLNSILCFILSPLMLLPVALIYTIIYSGFRSK